MNSTALVGRLNFAYQLTNGKFANQKFDAPKLLATGLLTPSLAVDLAGLGAAHPRAASAPAPPPSASEKLTGYATNPATAAAIGPASLGATVAMRVLEATMIGAPVSAQTNHLIDEQLRQQPPNPGPTDTLNLLTALVIGSPEFQLR
jgi:hypothetical protein